MLANEFLAFEHSPLFFVDIIIHCSLLRTCRVRVEEKEEFLVYTVLWTLTCHPYLESATALSDNVLIMYFDLPPLNGKMPSTGINIGDHSSDCTCDVH